MQQFIDDLIYDLAHAPPMGKRVFNQYAHTDENNAIRRANLHRYLTHMLDHHPAHLMVMEAPGYRGCRLTGVPVTSRRVMLDGVPELDIFGTKQGYQDTADAGFEDIQGEQSATILWRTLADLDTLPLIWNTFPLHPRKGSSPRSNRRPLKPETEFGGTFIHRIISGYKPEVIIAVGNVAYETLTTLGVNCVKVRHPAQGGKADFVTGLQRLL